MTDPKPSRPLPLPTTDTLPYWRAAAEGRLVIQHCRDCGHRQFYPRAFCTKCLSEQTDWIEVEGSGHIYTFTVCRIAPSPAFAAALPYAVAMVELKEGVRLLTNIVDSDISRVAVGAPVTVCFERIDDECTLPQFKLSE